MDRFVDFGNHLIALAKTQPELRLQALQRISDALEAYWVTLPQSPLDATLRANDLEQRYHQRTFIPGDSWFAKSGEQRRRTR
jgi:2-phospho-L-lactate transferase/gluconeogenesis factor (CofD/UPF0052 family)